MGIIQVEAAHFINNVMQINWLFTLNNRIDLFKFI